jgi:hypothetical protein
MSIIQATYPLSPTTRLEIAQGDLTQTGIYRFPLPRAARLFFETFQAYFKEEPQSGLQLVRMTLRDDKTLKVFLEEGARALERPGS